MYVCKVFAQQFACVTFYVATMPSACSLCVCVCAAFVSKTIDNGAGN